MPLLLGNHGQFRTGVSASAASVDPALLVWYKFDDSAAADGTNANGGTLINSGSGGSALNAAIQYCTWQTGYTGRALRWTPRIEASNTLTDRASVTSSALNLTTGGTIMCRLKCSSATSFNEYGVFGLFRSDGNQVFTLWANGVGGGAATRFLGAVTSASATGASAGISDTTGSGAINTWKHYAFTYDGAVTRLYINGSQVATRTDITGNFSYTGNLTLNLGWISFGNQSPGNGWNGDADDFRLYNTVLTASDIATIASQ